MNRRARARQAFLETHGSGPWPCEWCESPVTKLGPQRDDGVVHHRNEDPIDNKAENLGCGHRRCHSSYHQSKNNSSPWGPNKPGAHTRVCEHNPIGDGWYLYPDGKRRECRLCRARRRLRPDGP